MKIFTDLQAKLHHHGADLVGFCNLNDIPESKHPGFTCGISIAIALEPQIVAELENGPTPDYHQEYLRINEKLKDLSWLAVDTLQKGGFAAINGEVTSGGSDETLSTEIPHKTLAVLSGLGWIGKCALLVTREFGSAVRLTSVLCNLPHLRKNEPMESSCGQCRECVEHCPGKAPVGLNWRMGDDREKIFRAFECRKAARGMAKERLDIELTLCGICIGICPYTRRYYRHSQDV